jgi:hypothetical protein
MFLRNTYRRKLMVLRVRLQLAPIYLIADHAIPPSEQRLTLARVDTSTAYEHSFDVQQVAIFDLTYRDPTALSSQPQWIIANRR